MNLQSLDFGLIAETMDDHIFQTLSFCKFLQRRYSREILTFTMLEWMIHNIAWVTAGAVLILIGIKIVIFRVLKGLMKHAKEGEK